MNQTTYPDRSSDVPWLDGEDPVRVPDTSMLPGSEKAPPAALGLLKTAVQGAHHTIDRFANRAAPAVRKAGDRVAAAGATRDEWVEVARGTVRKNPLACVAAALALGAVIARIIR